MALVDLLHFVLIAVAIGAAYDVARRWLSVRRAPVGAEPGLSALAARVDENERAFKAVCVDWRVRFNELEKQVQTLPSEVQSKVAGTVAAIGALPSAPKAWR